MTAKKSVSAFGMPTSFGMLGEEPEAAAPVVTSISPAIGNPAGGGSTRTVTGTGFVSGCTATIGGTAQAVTFVNSTTLTFTPVAHAAGQVDFVVTNPDTQTSGSSGNNAYRYWDPNVLGVSALWVRPNYSSPTFTATTGGVNLGGGANAPDDSSGSPDFVRANSDKLTAATNLSTLIGTGSCTIAAVLDTDSIASTGASTVWLNECCVADSGGWCAMALGGAASNKAYMFAWDTAERKAEVTLSPVAGRHVLIGEKSTGTMYITQDGGANWVAGDACNTTGGTGTIRVGTDNVSNANFIDGRIKVLCLDDRDWTTQEAGLFKAWADAEHP